MFSDPAHTIAQFDVQSGSRVADLGSGSGTLALALARAVGESGRVYAVEVQKDMLTRLANRAKEERVHNLDVIWGDIERPGGTHLEDASADAAVASNVLFQVEDKPGFAEETKRILKQGGKLLLVDWSDSFSGTGPEPQAVVGEQQARSLFLGAGFRFVKKIEAGEHHYGLIFRKST